jgi:hypothetical protein
MKSSASDLTVSPASDTTWAGTLRLTLQRVIQAPTPSASQTCMRRVRRRRVKPVTETGVYRTELGTILRILEGNDGHLSVQMLKRTLWVPSPIGMAGLRLAPTTTRLTARQVRALPP